MQNRSVAGSFHARFTNRRNKSVSNASWGTKRSCPKCAARFYDLNLHPASCPKCGTSFDPVAILKPRRGRSRKFSNVTTETDADESVLTNIMAKASASKKPGVVDLDDDDKESLVEDAEEIEDFESIDELESLEGSESSGDDANEETMMEGYDKTLVDNVEDEAEDVEDEAEEAAPRPKARR